MKAYVGVDVKIHIFLTSALTINTGFQYADWTHLAKDSVQWVSYENGEFYGSVRRRSVE
jgi:hypothetical protein